MDSVDEVDGTSVVVGGVGDGVGKVDGVGMVPGDFGDFSASLDLSTGNKKQEKEN